MRKALVGTLGTILLVAGGAVFASPTLVGTTTDPTGINNLVVDGTRYDVTFGTSQPSSPWAPLSGGGTGAAVALASALNGLGVTGLGGDNSFVPFFALLVDYGPECRNLCTHGGDAAEFESGQGWRPDETFSNVINGYIVFGCSGTGRPCIEGATFTATKGVPEPASLALFALGLVGVGLSRRRLARSRRAAASQLLRASSPTAGRSSRIRCFLSSSRH